MSSSHRELTKTYRYLLFKGYRHQAQPSYRAEVSQILPNDHRSGRHRNMKVSTLMELCTHTAKTQAPVSRSVSVNYIRASTDAQVRGALKEAGALLGLGQLSQSTSILIFPFIPLSHR